MHIPEPAVSRRGLTLSAAIVWGLVGAFLSVRAVFWFAASDRRVTWMVLLALAIGFIKGHLLFSWIARRNIRRIHEMSPHKKRICIFAFQAFQSYAVILVMIGVGLLLRRSSLSREILAVIYLAVGSALLYASPIYWRARGL